MDLLDRAEDHRRGALDRPAHQVPLAVAVVYLGEPPVGPYGLAARAGGHVAASQHAGQYVRCRVELGTQDIGESAVTAAVLADTAYLPAPRHGRDTAGCGCRQAAVRPARAAAIGRAAAAGRGRYRLLRVIDTGRSRADADRAGSG